MSYNDFLKSTAGWTAPPSDRPGSAAPRKPATNFSAVPFTTPPGSVHKTVTQYNSLRSASTSSHGPVTSPAVTSTSKRSFSPMASGLVTKSSADALRNNTPSPATVSSISISTPATNGSTIITTALPHHIETNGMHGVEAENIGRSTAAGDYPSPPAHAEWHNALKSCLSLQNNAVTNHNKRPFAAILLGPDKTTTLLSHFSISHVQHAESELARLASLHFSMAYLRKCTLVSTWEPCAMCAGTIYWSGIGRVVYAASESKLKELTGPRNTENMTMDLPCRIVFDAGQNKVDVVGPVPGWEDKVAEESRKWWQDHKASSMTVNPEQQQNVGANLSIKNGPSGYGHHVITNPPPEEGVLSRIGEDGEYKADLTIDWMM